MAHPHDPPPTPPEEVTHTGTLYGTRDRLGDLPQPAPDVRRPPRMPAPLVAGLPPGAALSTPVSTDTSGCTPATPSPRPTPGPLENVPSEPEPTRSWWTEPEERTVVRLLTGDSPCTTPSELSAEYTAETGKVRTPHAWAARLPQLAERYKFDLPPGLLDAFRDAARLYVAPVKGAVQAVNAAEARTRWLDSEEASVIEAVKTCSTPQAFLAHMERAARSFRTPKAYGDHLSRMMDRDVLPVDLRPSARELVVTLRRYLRPPSKPARVSDVPFAPSEPSPVPAASYLETFAPAVPLTGAVEPSNQGEPPVRPTVLSPLYGDVLPPGEGSAVVSPSPAPAPCSPPGGDAPSRPDPLGPGGVGLARWRLAQIASLVGLVKSGILTVEQAWKATLRALDADPQ